MEPTYFDQTNVNYVTPKELKAVTKDLPAHRNNRSEVITLWTTSFWNRLRFLFGNKLWLTAYAGDHMPPVRMDIGKAIIDSKLEFSVTQASPNRKRRRAMKKVFSK